MPCQIFISYRRNGGEVLAHLFYTKLSQEGYKVFLDVESLRSGKFNSALYEKIDECEDFLLILPPNALDRCNDPNDWLRLEIEHALKSKKNIIPIMMRNFIFPKELPETLKGLAYFNGINANMEFFDAVIEKLTKNFFQSKLFNPQERKRIITEKSEIISSDIMLLLDTSASMYENIDELKKVALILIDKMIDFQICRVGLITFNFSANLLCPLTQNDNKELNEQIKKINVNGVTNTLAALKLAESEFEKSGDRRKIIILVTDGYPDDQQKTFECAKLLRSKNVLIYSIGLGLSDFEYLRKISGDYRTFIIEDINNLMDSFKIIAGIINN